MKDFDDYIADLRRRAVQRPQLVEAMIELTYGCNLRCVHCYNPTHQAKNEMATEDVLRILQELAVEGVLWVGFTGGELLTRHDALEIVARARELGMIVSIVTNATLMTPSLARELKALEVYQVDVSLYGATAETYERVTRVPGSFEKFCSGLDALQEVGLPVLLKRILMTLNVHESEAMQVFADLRNLPSRAFTEIHPKVNGDLEPLAYRLPAQACVALSQNERANSADEDAPVANGCAQPGGLFECLCGKSNAAITPYGQMNLCLSMQQPRYDLNRGTVLDGWKHLQEIVRDAAPGPDYQCGTCPISQACDRGTMDGWLEHGRIDGPCIDHFREMAELKMTRSTVHGKENP